MNEIDFSSVILSFETRKKKKTSFFDNRITTRSQGYLFVSSFCFLLCLLRSTAELQIIATEGCGEFPNGATSVVSRSANVRCNEMEWNPNCVLSFDCLVADRSFSYRLDLNFVVVCAINSTEERVAVGWRGEGEMLLLLLLEGGLAACCGFRFPILVHLFHVLSLVGVVIFCFGPAGVPTASNMRDNIAEGLCKFSHNAHDV